MSDLHKRWVKSQKEDRYDDNDGEYGPINFAEVRPLLRGIRARDVKQFDDILTEYARRRREHNRSRYNQPK